MTLYDSKRSGVFKVSVKSIHFKRGLQYLAASPAMIPCHGSRIVQRLFVCYFNMIGRTMGFLQTVGGTVLI